MKVLGNPIVVGVLALLAAGLVVKSLWPALRGRVRFRPAAGVTTPAPAALPPVASPGPLAPLAALTVSAPMPDATVPLENPAQTGASLDALLPPEINLELVRQDAPRWSEGRRDPFQIRSTPARPVYPPAMELLTLGAIWRQTDSSLAVLNNHIYAAGDSVLRFVIKSIEPDRVWVQGPNGREAVEFKSGVVLNTNFQARAAVPASVALPNSRP